MHKSLLIAATCVTLAACDDKPADAPDDQATAKGAEKTTATGAATTPETEPAQQAAWQMTLQGPDLPTASGPTVMATKVGPALTYKLVGTESTGTIMIEGAEKGQVGDFEPKNFSVLYPKSKIQCGASTLGKGADAATVALKLEKKGAGVRGTIEGEVTCRNVDGSGEPTTAKVSGWFED